MIGKVCALGFVLMACGGGGDGLAGANDAGNASSGNPSPSPAGPGAGSSGGCDAICRSSATVRVDVSNEGNRLEGAVVETCRKGECVRGTITKNGSAYKLSFKPSLDAGASDLGVEGRVTIGPAAGSLRVEAAWYLGYGGASGALAADGDTYTLSGRTGEDGPELFTHSFTATYENQTVCGSTCSA